MPYLVQGTAQQLFKAFGQDWAIEEGADNTQTIGLDLTRSEFLGTEEQAVMHLNTWRHNALGRYYLQGNMSAGNLWCLLGVEPLKKATDNLEQYHQNLVRQHFAYMSDAGETCGLMVVYRQDDPTQWMVGLVKNGHAAPNDRKVAFLSSLDLAPLITSPDSGVTVSSVPLLENQLIQQIGSDLPQVLLKNAFNMGSGGVNPRFKRAELLTRFLNVEQANATIFDPVPFVEVDFPVFFAENRALDLYVKYDLKIDFPLTFAKLQRDYLSESSGLRKELEAIKLTEDELVNKNLVRMTVTLYEKGLLEQNRELLNNHGFIKRFGNFMRDETQMRLIPFLIQKTYDNDLLRHILSEPAYYNAINLLVEINPELTQDIPQFFQDQQKLEDLKFIHALPDEDCKKLCLIFWVKGNLSIDGYQEIADATKKYPLMASALVALDKTKTIKIDNLQNLALTPKKHLQQSMKHHFAKELATYSGTSEDLRKMSLKELEDASAALMLLRQSGIEKSQRYQLVLGKDKQFARDKKGQALRLFLPQLAAVENDTHRKLLIEILFKGIEGIQTQGKAVLAIKNPEQLALAKSLRERFICVTQLQELGFKKEIIELAAQEDSEQARRFRHVILRVEAQCKIVHERLNGSISYRDVLKKWATHETEYRMSLYSIAYDGVIDSKEDLRARLKTAEKKILDIVDPEIESFLQAALIVIANIVIGILSGGIANAIRYKNTGNPWFFYRTDSGDELRLLNNQIQDLVIPDAIATP